ncbi:MAG TPA: hypothetical protein VIW29_00210 [Polyangiaceae bacterium]
MFGRLALLSLGLVLGACNYPKPPAAWSGDQPAPVAQPAPRPAPKRAPPPPPPPPPPKCQALSENCSAGADTKLTVGDLGAWFTPPQGWHYARGTSESITVHPDGTAMIILAPSPDPSDIAPAIEAMAAQHGITGLKVEKLKRRLKKPQQSLPAASGTVDLWEVDKAQQGQALVLADKGKGTLLVLVARPAPEHTLIGLGFVVETVAEAEAPSIMQSVQTLRDKP